MTGKARQKNSSLGFATNGSGDPRPTRHGSFQPWKEFKRMVLPDGLAETVPAVFPWPSPTFPLKFFAPAPGSVRTNGCCTRVR